jgi:TrkA domain protein
MPVIRETDLPGIGRKFQVECRGGDKLVIIVHDDGKRELYHFKYEDPDESISMVTLDDTEARQIAGIIGGLAYRPKTLETVEVVLEDLFLDWYKVEPGWLSAGRTLGELNVRQQTGAAVIALIGKQRKVNPGPDDVIEEGAMVVAAGEKQQVRALHRLLINGTG